MEELTKREFERKELDIENFLKESYHFRELFLNENSISIPLSWRSYSNIKDNREANNYLNDLIRECKRLETRIDEIGKTITILSKDQKCNFKECIEHILTDKNKSILVTDIKILNDELNLYIHAIKEMEQLILSNNGIIRHELNLNDKFKNGKFYSGISEGVEFVINELNVRKYYSELL